MSNNKSQTISPHQKVLLKKKAELLKTRDQIMDLGDSISSISVKLKKKRDDEKDFRVSTGKISSHNKKLDLDRTKRPSDRTFESRNYSNMDMNVWRYDQMREWFNHYAQDVEVRNIPPSETGYTIRID